MTTPSFPTPLDRETLLLRYTEALLENDLEAQAFLLELAQRQPDTTLNDLLWETHVEVGETLLQEDKAAYQTVLANSVSSGTDASPTVSLSNVRAQVRQILSREQVLFETRAEAQQWLKQQKHQSQESAQEPRQEGNGAESLPLAQLDFNEQTVPLTLALVAKEVGRDPAASLPRAERNLLQRIAQAIAQNPQAQAPIQNPPSLREMREVLRRMEISTAEWVVARFQQCTYGLLLSRREETIRLAAARRAQAVNNSRPDLRTQANKSEAGTSERDREEQGL